MMDKTHMLKYIAILLAAVLVFETRVSPVYALETAPAEPVPEENIIVTEEIEAPPTPEPVPEENVIVTEEIEAPVKKQETEKENVAVADETKASEEMETDLGVQPTQAFDEETAKNLEDELSQNGNVVTQYVNEEDQKLKTIVWAKGVTPPNMNDFIKDKSNVGTEQYVTYQAPYQAGKGWYDVNKTIGRVEDAKLCYAAAASNALYWWLKQNAIYIDQYLAKYPDDEKKQDLRKLRNSFISQSDSAIYKRYINQFSSRQDGFWSDILMDQFVNGYVPNDSGATNHSEAARDKLVQNGPSEKGGFFYDIFGTTLLTNRAYSGDFQAFGNDLKSHFLDGKLVLIDYGSGAISHVVTIWGLEYDTDGQISAIYLTDSDDETTDNGMVRYLVKNKNGKPILSTNINGMNGSMIKYVQTISLGQEIWEKRLNVDPNAPKIPIVLKWENTEFTYDGSSKIPYAEASNIEQGDDVIVWVEGAQTNAGTYTANVVLKGASAGRYELPENGQKEFVIKKVEPKVRLIARLNQETKIVDFRVTLTGTNNEKPTGTITLKSGQDVIEGQIPVVNGVASHTWTNLPLGNRRITAEFEPSAEGVGRNYEKAWSNFVSINLPKKEQSELHMTPIGDKKFGNGSFTLATTGGTGKGGVTYSCSTDDVLSINGSTATIIGAGTTTITAVKAGDDEYDSISTSQTITVAKAEAFTVTYPTAGELVYGQKLSESSLAEGSKEYGSFVWENAEQIPSVSNSGYTMRFVPSRQTLKNYERIIGEVGTVAVPVSRANTTVALNAQTVRNGGVAKLVLTASVGKSLYGDSAEGTVTFLASSDSGSTYMEISTVSVVNGAAVFSWKGMPQQAYQIQAHYSGDQNYNVAYSARIRVDVGGEIGEPDNGTGNDRNDGVNSNSLNGKSKFIALLYENTLGRSPAQNEIDHWVKELFNGKSGADAAYGFLFSQEFENKNYNNFDYVECLYLSLMGRPSDVFGKLGWVQRMDDGMSRAYVFKQFINSQEFANLCAEYGIVRGSVTLTEARDENYDVTRFVGRNYEQFLGREYDDDGLNYWSKPINEGIKTMQEIAYGFVFSPECINQNLSDSEFVAMLYRGCFDRAGERSGINYWAEKLASGEMNRIDVFYGFANSQEFQNMVKSYGL